MFTKHKEIRQKTITYLTCNKCGYKTDEAEYETQKIIKEINSHYFTTHIQSVLIPFKPYLDFFSHNFETIKGIYIIDNKDDFDLICDIFYINNRNYNEKIKYYSVIERSDNRIIVPFNIKDLYDIKIYIDLLIENCEKVGITKV